MLVRWRSHARDGADFSLQGYYDYTRRDIPEQLTTSAATRSTSTFSTTCARAGRARSLVGRRLPLDERRDRQHVVRDVHARERAQTQRRARSCRTGSPVATSACSSRSARSSSTTTTRASRRSRARGSPGSIDGQRAFWGAVSRAVRIPSRLDSDLRLTVPIGLVGIPFYVTADGSPSYDSEELIAYEAVTASVRPNGCRSTWPCTATTTINSRPSSRTRRSSCSHHRSYAVLPHTIENSWTGT